MRAARGNLHAITAALALALRLRFEIRHKSLDCSANCTRLAPVLGGKLGKNPSPGKLSTRASKNESQASQKLSEKSQNGRMKKSLRSAPSGRRGTSYFCMSRYSCRATARTSSVVESEPKTPPRQNAAEALLPAIYQDGRDEGRSRELRNDAGQCLVPSPRKDIRFKRSMS
jgi:hypothetical protein